jgi:diguanylate cyclase (GGDEF)-like protein/PAS domain S-box-containing protein
MPQEHQGERLTVAEIRGRVADALMSEVGIVAINVHGLFVPVPPTVPLGDRRVLTGYASAMDLVVGEDAVTVIEAWQRASQTGASSAQIHLARVPETEVTLQFFDTMSDHGVFLGIVGLDPRVDLAVDGGDNPALRPRVGWMRKDQLATVIEVDAAVPEMLGCSAAKLLTVRTLEFLDPADHDRAISSWMSMLGEPGCRRRARLRHRHEDGSWRWFDVTNHNRLNDPAHSDVFTEMVDVTDEMEAQEALRSRENLLRRLTETLPVGILQFDAAGKVLYRNDRVEALLGTRSGSTLSEQLAGIEPGMRAQVLAAATDVVAGRGDGSLEVPVAALDGSVCRLTVALRALTDDDGMTVGGLACLTDVTESVELREQLADRATYDSLTRCLNRSSILAALQEQLDASAGHGVAVVFVDLDGFKQVNDEFGHEAGDRVLVECAHRLAAGIRGNDVLGRIGGDEFLAVCPGVDDHASAQRIGRRVAKALALLVGDEQTMLRASIGVAWAVGETTTADALVAESDEAMYESKRDGQGRPVVRDLQLVGTLSRPGRAHA